MSIQWSVVKPAIVSYTTDLTQSFRFMDSLKRNRWEQDTFVIYEGYWQGLRHRFKRVMDCRQYLIDQGYTHMLMIDSYDVIVVKTPGNLDRLLFSLGDPDLLISGEKNCYPDKTLEKFFTADSPWKYLNSNFCLKLNSKIEFNCDDENDQLYMTHFYLANKDRTDVKIVLDTKCKVFQCMFKGLPSEFLFDEDKVVNKITGTEPMFIHANGSSGFSVLDRRFTGA